MSRKTFIWGGLFIGSTIGSFLPNLWNSGMFSMSGILLSTAGGIIGIWAGLKLASILDL